MLRLVTCGRSNPEIAEELVISVNTVTRHVSNIFNKTEVVPTLVELEVAVPT